MSKPKPGTAVQRGAVRNAPPSLEWVGVDRLAVDPAYQRNVDSEQSRRIIVGMVKCWDWALCQPLVVSRRADGSLFILDGQHRWMGAIERGDVPHLPCVILTGCDLGGEAETFVALNMRRQRLSNLDLFNGMLAAGDVEAARVAQILTETGWSLARTKNVAAWKPGQLDCAPMLVRELRSSGEAPVRNALTTMREAWPDTPVTVPATLLRALITIYRDDDLDGSDPDVFVEMLGSCEPKSWVEAAVDVQRRNPMFSRPEAIVRGMIDELRGAIKDRAA